MRARQPRSSDVPWGLHCNKKWPEKQRLFLHASNITPSTLERAQGMLGMWEATSCKCDAVSVAGCDVRCLPSISPCCSRFAFVEEFWLQTDRAQMLLVAKYGWLLQASPLHDCFRFTVCCCCTCEDMQNSDVRSLCLVTIK